MEQQTPKFRLRLNFFDSIVLLLALLAGAFLLWRGPPTRRKTWPSPRPSRCATPSA